MIVGVILMVIGIAVIVLSNRELKSNIDYLIEEKHDTDRDYLEKSQEVCFLRNAISIAGLEIKNRDEQELRPRYTLIKKKKKHNLK